MKVAHIINPFKVSQSSDLYFAQPVTFETMKAAKKFTGEEVEVELLSVCYSEDYEVVPAYFTKIGNLNRSVLDIIKPEKKKKLPLIKDILDMAFHNTEADYLIYSNVDIALMPAFYKAIKKIIEDGYDAFVINRRTIKNNYNDIKDIPLMYAETGEPHPGFDCFVFKRDMYKHFNLGTACVGANWIGRVLIANLITNAVKFRIFDNLHLTFHIGDDRSWKNHEFYDYDRHNETQLYNTLLHFSKNKKLTHPMLEQFLKQIENINIKIPLYNEVTISQNPIFVVGFTRSGTTLLQALIATQGNIHTFPETHFFCEYLNKYLKLNHGLVAKECLDEFFKKAREFSGLDIDWYEIDYFKILADKGFLTEKNLFENIVKHYLIKQLAHKDIPGTTWLEKTPYHGFVMDKILQIYPGARFVSIIRHPVPAIYSTKKHIHPNESYEFIANKWKRLVNRTEEFKVRHPDKIYSVKYEDLINDPNVVISDMFKHLNMNFDKGKLSSFSSVAQKIIMPFEWWKKDVCQTKINSQDEIDFLNEIPVKDIFTIQQLLKEEIFKNGFEIYYKDKQDEFNRICN